MLTGQYTPHGRARLSGGDSLVTKLAQAVSAFTEHGAKLYLPFYEGLLAELGCEGQSADLALTRVDGALALSEQTRQHWIYPFLHRVRGGILLKRDPANPAAEDAFLAALNVAKQQGGAVSACSPRLHLPSSINRPDAPPTRTQSSRRHSKASLRRQKCRKSPRRRDC